MAEKLDNNDTCPFCKEEIKKNSIKCKHCQSILVPINENIISSGVNQSVQIVTNTQDKQKEKNSEKWIGPSMDQSNSYIGHGWSCLILSIIMFLSFVDAIDGNEIDAAHGITIISFISLVPWSIWIISKEGSNKLLPAISLILSILMLFASFGD